ncbi:MAG: TonB-dependent receptor, partial [Halioglobus sp.]
PNWMDPPLSYVVGGQLESLELYRGIAPVSVAQESIGGAVDAKTRKGEFTSNKNFTLSGRVMASAQSVNDGYHLETALYASNNQHRIKAAAMTETADDADFDGGTITPSEYERQRYDLGYGFRSGNHTVQIDYGFQDTGEAGTPALPMDIESIEGDLLNLSYDYDNNAGMQIAVSLYGSDLKHSMSNYHLRSAPSGPRWRRNDVSSENAGFKVSTTMREDDGAWVFGWDGFTEEHDSTITNPNNAMFFVTNYNGAEREIIGAFLERQQTFNDRWRAEFGIRYNRISMNADDVNGTPAMMMPPAQALRDNFNSADRSQTDNNLDLVAKVWFKANETTSWYAGIAQKNRSPSYIERYLCLPLEATGGLADGFTYTGNIALNPETAREIELGLDFSNNRLTISPRLFYRKVDDYIQGTPSTVAPAVMFVNMMNNAMGTSNPAPLQFTNVDAVLYGFDVDWAVQITENLSISGLINYVRGERDDSSNDDLYRIAPLNAAFRIGYARDDWSAELESAVYAEQDDVSATNAEQETSGYGVVNVRAIWQTTPSLQLAAGVDNLFDRNYEDHLSGYNRAANPDIALRSRLPGYGANAYVRALYQF